jgi:uncharacterized protein DUF6884
VPLASGGVDGIGRKEGRVERERIGLIGCVKSKRAARSAAADLCTSTLFMGRRRWVEASCSRWFILSAKHGLVAPDDMLDPYDETLTTKGQGARQAWSARVLTQLRNALGDIGAYEFEIHAGTAYSGYGLRSGLASAGAVVTLPTEGLSLGKQLAFYRDERPA